MKVLLAILTASFILMGSVAWAQMGGFGGGGFGGMGPMMGGGFGGGAMPGGGARCPVAGALAACPWIRWA